MKIEYVLIEKQNEDFSSAEKERIISLIRNCFGDVSNNEIILHGKRKGFPLKYIVTCGDTTSDKSTDYVYNISLCCEHNDKRKAAELLERAHLLFRQYIKSINTYHLIIANDELSEYFCNRAYPKYQRFERQLRHLLFKIVTKAYGNLWAKETLPEDMKKSLRDNLKSQNGLKRDDMLIEAALHEMTIGQLIQYLFYGPSELSIPDYLDEHTSPDKLKSLSKEELIELIEKSRKKSIWNLFLADDFSIDEPQAKLKRLRENRNKVAHCKEFYSEDYSLSVQYIDLFLPKIESAVEKATIHDLPTTRDIFRGFSEFTFGLVSLSQQLNETIGPAIRAIAEISAPMYKTLLNEAFQKSIRISSEISNQYMLNIAGYLRDAFPPSIQLEESNQTRFENLREPSLYSPDSSLLDQKENNEIEEKKD